ncbi:thioesterase [Gilliamella sp. App2-1]|nr:thioesterase [Gilliamella apicola]OCG21809.1 thioesterase [Gilliamella apicola]
MDDAIEDLYQQFITHYDGSAYVIFGHSLGGLMAFELIHYILQHGHPMPKVVFFSGSRPPDRMHDETILHTLADAEFMREIAKLGGMSGDVFRNKELMDIFTPIIKNDYRLYEQYNYQTKPQLLSCPIVLLHGDADSLVTFEELPQWEKFTDQETKTIIFPQADHFFVDKKYKEVVHIVNQIITEVIKME